MVILADIVKPLPRVLEASRAIVKGETGKWRCLEWAGEVLFSKPTAPPSGSPQLQAIQVKVGTLGLA